MVALMHTVSMSFTGLAELERAELARPRPITPPGRSAVLDSWAIYLTRDPEYAVTPSLEEVTAVFDALSDETWTFRSADGIAKSTGLTPTRVRHILQLHRPQLRQPEVRDRLGRELWTLRSRPLGWRERYVTWKRRIGTW